MCEFVACQGQWTHQIVCQMLLSYCSKTYLCLVLMQWAWQGCTKSLLTGGVNQDDSLLHVYIALICHLADKSLTNQPTDWTTFALDDTWTDKSIKMCDGKLGIGKTAKCDFFQNMQSTSRVQSATWLTASWFVGKSYGCRYVNVHLWTRTCKGNWTVEVSQT